MIIGTMIIGNRVEPFLGACLESVKDAVDLVVINDNSSDKNNPNIEIIKNSALYKQGKIKLLFYPFNGFGDARSKYLDYINELNCGADSWILKLDSDEVHPSSIKTVTRDILPRLPKTIGMADSYFFQFMQSFDRIYSIDRRHDLFVRYNADLKWEGAVHEKLAGQKGKRIALPYIFYHYGYVNLKEDILDRWKLYAACGDASYPDLDKVEKESFLSWEGRFCVKFKGRHPSSMNGLIKRMKKERKEEFKAYDIVINEHFEKNKSLKIRNFLKIINCRFRVYFRALQLFTRFIYKPALAGKFFNLMRNI